MTAKILQFPKRPKRSAKQAYLLAFFALLSECGCRECRQYRRLLETDELAAENFLMGRD